MQYDGRSRHKNHWKGELGFFTGLGKFKKENGVPASETR